MSCPFDIYDRIVCSLSLESETLAELVKIELQLAAGTCIIRYVEEDMNLMVNILDILERWK